MKIKWLGHSCFSLTTSQGTVVVTDPYDESVGYGRPGVDADLVTVSHDHHDHNCLEALGKLDALLIPVGGVYTINGVQAAQLALAVNARVTVAMHFMTEKLGFELMKPEFFLNAMGKKAVRLNEFELDESAPGLILPVLGE